MFHRAHSAFLCLDLLVLVLFSVPPFSQNEDLRRNSSRMDSERSKTIVRLLNSATNNTQYYYGNDVKTAAQLLNHVLQYESQQAGFDLTAMRDAEFNEVEAFAKCFRDYLGPLKLSLEHWEHWWHTALHWLILTGRAT